MKYVLLALFLLPNVSLAETRKRIGVLDTGISANMISADYMCKDTPVVTLSSKHNGLDWHGHGTNVIGLIAERIDIKKYCITSYSLNKDAYLSDMISLMKLMKHPNLIGLNISLSSNGGDAGEELALRELSIIGTTIFIAAGNSGKDLTKSCDSYPACHKSNIPKLIVVGNGKGGRRYLSSNYGKVVTVWKDGSKVGNPVMSGTSQATAIACGEYFSK